MDKLNKKNVKTSRGYTYTYYTSPAKDDKPTLLLCHGWPDSAELWSGVANDYLVPAGYGVVGIDCLGYAGTDKPTDPKEYAFKGMTQDLVDILDKENIQKVVSLGHDWGCGLSQRLYNFHPNRTSGLVFVNVAYLNPNAGPFNLDATIQITEQIFGKGLYWYWKLFAAPEGPKILDAHKESLWAVMHGKPETWNDTLLTRDGVKNFLEEDRTQPTEPYATEQMKKDWIARMDRDKFDGPQCWYSSTVLNHQYESDKSISEENYKISVPCLFFGGTRDLVCRPQLMGPSVEAGLVPDLKTVTVDAGHWSMLAKPKEFGDALTGWLKEKF